MILRYREVAQFEGAVLRYDKDVILSISKSESGQYKPTQLINDLIVVWASWNVQIMPNYIFNFPFCLVKIYSNENN